MQKISKAKLYELFDDIASKQTLYIPTDREAGAAEYRKYESGMKLTKELNTVRSAKDFFFPQTENLAEFKLTARISRSGTYVRSAGISWFSASARVMREASLSSIRCSSASP